jgi:hypothetical protein
MTASRVYSRIPLSPDRALRQMLKKAGTAYDPLLMKVFVNCMGLYPVGTIVVLDTGEWGVVVGVPASPERRALPTITLIRDAAGREIDGETLNLADPAVSATRRIVSTADAARSQVDLARLFL